MDEQDERPDPPEFLNIVGVSFLWGMVAALAWWGYQAFTWLRTGKTLDWTFVTILHLAYPRFVGLNRLDQWAACSSNPSIPSCNGAPAWAGVGKLVDWWLTLDVGLGLWFTAAGLGVAFATLIIALWNIPFAAGWNWLRPYLAPVLDPLGSAWQRWVLPALDAYNAFWESRLGVKLSELGTTLVVGFFCVILVRGCFGS